jgi:hypothetical protein
MHLSTALSKRKSARQCFQEQTQPLTTPVNHNLHVFPINKVLRKSPLYISVNYRTKLWENSSSSVQSRRGQSIHKCNPIFSVWRTRPHEKRLMKMTWKEPESHLNSKTTWDHYRLHFKRPKKKRYKRHVHRFRMWTRVRHWIFWQSKLYW